MFIQQTVYLQHDHHQYLFSLTTTWRKIKYIGISSRCLFDIIGSYSIFMSHPTYQKQIPRWTFSFNGKQTMGWDGMLVTEGAAWEPRCVDTVGQTKSLPRSVLNCWICTSEFKIRKRKSLCLGQLAMGTCVLSHVTEWHRWIVLMSRILQMLQETVIFQLHPWLTLSTHNPMHT